MPEVKELKLPAWAKVGPPTDKLAIILEADMDGAMTEWHGLLGVESPTQYSIEVAYQCAKMDLQAALQGTEYDPHTSGKSHEFRFSKAEQWALKAHPEGRGVVAATKGREARSHYVRVRGSIPFSV